MGLISAKPDRLVANYARVVQNLNYQDLGCANVDGHDQEQVHRQRVQLKPPKQELLMALSIAT